jgi:hypothetical protein
MNALAARTRTTCRHSEAAAGGVASATQAMSLQEQLRGLQDQQAFQKRLQGGLLTGGDAVPPSSIATPSAPPMGEVGGFSAPGVTPPQAPAQAPAAPPQDYYAKAMQQADALDAFAQSGQPGAQAAAKLARDTREQALKWRDENKGVETVMGPNGPMLIQTRKHGDPTQLPYEPKPDMQILSLGNRQEAVDKLRVKPGQTWQQGLSPDTQFTGNVTMRGQNMTDARSRESNAISQGNQQQNRTGELRKEFNALQTVKAYGEVQPVLQSAREALGTDTAAADLNLIYAAAKVFDPGSVVRESETKMAIGTGSPSERFKGQFNYVVGGGRLTPEVRQNLMAQIESRARGFESGYKSARTAYEGVAKKQGIDPADVFIEPIANTGSPAREPTPAEIAAEMKRRGLK